MSIYAIIYSIEIKNKTLIEISSKLINFENVFFSKTTIILLKYNEYKYAINLIFDKTFSHEFLYNMFQKNLKRYKNM